MKYDNVVDVVVSEQAYRDGWALAGRRCQQKGKWIGQEFTVYSSLISNSFPINLKH